MKLLVALTPAALACKRSCDHKELSEFPDSETETISSECKILALHGGGGSSASFRNQAGMVDLIHELDECEFVFADAPLGGVWFLDPPGGKKEPTTDPTWGDVTIKYLDQLVAEQGPFYGLLGYSQGSATIPVYLASLSNPNAFNRVMMYNGYLPTTHLGLMKAIDDAAEFAIPAMVFSGVHDTWFGPLAPAQAEKFSNAVEIISQLAGHELPTSNDPTFQQTVNFIRAGLN